jgi:hypothetical protein
MKVINFFGGPGSGKSTAAAGLFYLLKKKKYNVELVTEFAKDLVYSEDTHALSQQNYVFANQEYRLSRLVGKVDIAITDSPLILATFYTKDTYPKSFDQLCLDLFNGYDNENFFVNRNHIYSQSGRVQNEKEAMFIDDKIWDFLFSKKIPFREVTAGDDVPEKVLEIIMEII